MIFYDLKHGRVAILRFVRLLGRTVVRCRFKELINFLTRTPAVGVPFVYARDGVSRMSNFGSKEVARAAILMATSVDRDDENAVKSMLAERMIRAAAVDYGGEFVFSANKIVERAIVAAKREGLIESEHAEEGALAGAAHEALTQILPKAVGFNVGGKIGIARKDDHISVAMFFVVGMLHLNEVAIGLGHRVIHQRVSE